MLVHIVYDEVWSCITYWPAKNMQLCATKRNLTGAGRYLICLRSMA
jgi:hypothetical protein